MYVHTYIHTVYKIQDVDGKDGTSFVHGFCGKFSK